MNILFVHQSFPSQYIHIIRSIASHGAHHVTALGINPPDRRLPASICYIRYSLRRGTSDTVHPLASETETKIIRGEACALAAFNLKRQGYIPDIICVHPGWGEALFLPDIWPGVPLLNYMEFYYHPYGYDSNFDPEFSRQSHWWSAAKVRMKNACLELALESSTWNITPTMFQLSSFPRIWRDSFSVIHDGIDCHLAKPREHILPLRLNDLQISPDEPIITFVSRSIEPTRGCHTMIRAIPRLQQLLPFSHILFVGSSSGVSYGRPCPSGEWKDQFLSEIHGNYDASRVHFLGQVTHENLIHLFQRSSCHVYLTYPFVLSWSLLEAMACGCAVVASATPPVEEVIVDGDNGLLVNFFSSADLAQAISEVVRKPGLARKIGHNARQTIIKNYNLHDCVSRHLSIIQLVASGSLGPSL